MDDTPAVQALFSSLKSALPELEKLLDECCGEWAYEDPVYRLILCHDAPVASSAGLKEMTACCHE